MYHTLTTPVQEEPDSDMDTGDPDHEDPSHPGPNHDGSPGAMEESSDCTDEPNQEEEANAAQEDESEENQTKLALLQALQEVGRAEGSFKGRKRPPAKWLEKDSSILEEIDIQAKEIWEDMGMETLWDLNRLVYAAAIVATARLTKVNILCPATIEIPLIRLHTTGEAR